MARNLEPQCRQCRREGMKLYEKDRCYSDKCAMVEGGCSDSMESRESFRSTSAS